MVMSGDQAARAGETEGGTDNDSFTSCVRQASEIVLVAKISCLPYPRFGDFANLILLDNFGEILIALYA